MREWAEKHLPSHRRHLLIGMGAVTFLALLVRAPLFGQAFAAPDTAQYLDVARGVFHDGYTSNLRPPAYSTLLAVLELVGLEPVHAVVFLQNIVGVLFPGFVLAVGWRFFNSTVGIVGGFLAAASPIVIGIEQFALSDYLFSICIFIAAAILAEAAVRLREGRPGWRWAIAAGAIFGLGCLLRANGLYAVAAMPLALMLGAPASWRQGLRLSAVAVGALIVVIAPWCIHNLIRFDDLSLASEGGISLYARTISYAEIPPSRDSEDGRIAYQVYNTAEPGLTEPAVGTTIGVFQALRKQQGLNGIEAAGAMSGLAKETILDAPGDYLKDTLQILERFQGVYNPGTLTAVANTDQIATTTGYIRALSGTRQGPLGASDLTRWPWQAAQTLTEILFVLTIGGLLILLLPFLGDATSRAAGTTFLILGLLGVVGVALTARFEIRHPIVFAPFVWVLAPASVVVVVRTIVGYLPARPRPRTRHAES
jgi:Dolichyl-phosphate-mannose-protein mannosyltransferase